MVQTKAFYTTVIREPATRAQKVGWLFGPFASEVEARVLIALARREAAKIDAFSDFDAFGVTARTATNHPPGVLNGKIEHAPT